MSNFIWQYPGEVDRVIDGDTVVCHVRFSPTQEEHDVSVRVDGINALELSQQFGGEAKAFAQSLLPVGAKVTLVARDHREKYGRFLARIVMADGRDFGMQMLIAKASDGVTPLAMPYNP